MKKNLLTIFWLLISIHLFSQSEITNNGNYIFVSVNKSLDQNGNVLVIQSTINSWKREFKRAIEPKFTEDSRKVIFMKSDTLSVLTLGTDERFNIAGATSYKQKGKWLACHFNKNNNELVLFNLITGNKQIYKDVAEFYFNDNATVLLLKIAINFNNSKVTALQWINLADNKINTLWSSKVKIIKQIQFDCDGRQLAFLVQKKIREKIINEIWYYKKGKDTAELLISNSSIGIDSGLVLSENIVKFTKRGDNIIFFMKEMGQARPNPNSAEIDIWSYTDTKLQSLQLKDLAGVRYAAVINISTRNILRLEHENEKLAGNYPGSDLNDNVQINDEYAIICHFYGDIFTYEYGESNTGGLVDAYSMNEYNWNKATQSNIFLVSLKNGSRKLLKEKINGYTAARNSFPYFRFSPEGKYVVYYDQDCKNYFSYEISTGSTRNSTKGILVSLELRDEENAVREFHSPWGILKWEEKDASFLVKDSYQDIWRVDPTGKNFPFNITNDFAKKNNISYLELLVDSKSQFRNNDEFLLRISIVDQYFYDGFYKGKFNKNAKIEKLIKLNGIYNYTLVQKAREFHLYLLRRNNDQDAGTFVYTNDFKTFVPITSNEPEKRRIIQHEIITWKTFDRKLSKGILYKPDNFDSSKKYPLVFTYYQKNWSQFPNIYFYGNHFNELLDSGYLVFYPDIHYTIGETGQSAYNYVVSAAKSLSKRNYIDSKRMGICGASFSGYETNYIVTHTNIFAAAIAGCGFTDFFSYYGTEDKDGQGYNYSAGVEIGQSRIGVTPWERPDLYLKNSPIFYADKVTTPLLLLHNDRDNRVPFSQSIEFFKALRRLGKKVWLINRNGEGHFGDAVQSNIHSIQFFNHYLKGFPAPIWMTRGITAKMKGLQTGLEFDNNIKTPGPGLVYDNEAALTPRQKELLKHKTTVNYEGRIVDVQTGAKGKIIKINTR